MFKFLWIPFISLLITTAYAQEAYLPSFSSQPTTIPTPAAKNSKQSPPASKPALSAQEFHGAVNNSFQENQNQIKQQIQQNLTKNLPVQAPSAPSPQQQPGSQNSTQPVPLPTSSMPAPAEQPPVDQSQSTQPSTQYQTAPQMPAAPAPAAPAQNNKPYTGFGAGNSGSGGKSNGTQQKSSGWNIQY